MPEVTIRNKITKLEQVHEEQVANDIVAHPVLGASWEIVHKPEPEVEKRIKIRRKK